MGIELATTIAGLDSSWPLINDKRSEGDDHLRLIKSVLKAQFPGAGGLGFNTPITAKEADLNAVFTTGVKTVFYQAAAPTGWTIANPGTNYTLVSAASGGTTGGGNGIGANLVTGCNVIPDHSHAQQGTFGSGVSNQSLSHNHTILGTGVKALSKAGAAFWNGTGGGAVIDAIRSTSLLDVNNTDLADLTGHTHNVTISGQTSNVNAVGGVSAAVGAWQPLYATVIIASKN